MNRQLALAVRNFSGIDPHWFHLAFISCFLAASSASAQTDLHAWHTNGQSWLVWTETPPRATATSYDIYSGDSLATNLADWTPVGRLLPEDWRAARLTLSTPASQWSVPLTNGYYQLKTNEALFVFTPHSAGTIYFAVVRHGDTILGASNTCGPVHQTLDQPVTCHPQNSGTTPTSHQPYTDYALWIDGRSDWTNSRPDIPVLGNASFNGTAALFRVYEPAISQPPGASLPVLMFTHASGSRWTLDVPGEAVSANLGLVLNNGLLVALDDGVWVFDSVQGMAVQEFTRWLGYWQDFDRFSATTNFPPDDVMVVDFTVRKNLWIQDWLAAHRSVDTNRVAWCGWSMGGGGGGINVRAHPERYSAASLFVPMVHTYVLDFSGAMQGSAEQNLPTPLGLGVDDLYFPTNSTAPDLLPPTRFAWGVNDEAITWNDPDLGQKTNVIPILAQSHLGFMVYWDERIHTAANWVGHWAGPDDTAQDGSPFLTGAFLTQFRNDQSFPAFSNDSDPDTNVFLAVPLCDTCTNWGTRGGYFEWDTASLTDTTNAWGVTLWMHSTNTTSFSNDIPAFASATTDVTIRRPRRFKPVPGALLAWKLLEASNPTNAWQSGTTSVASDGSVTVPTLQVFKDPKRARLQIRLLVLSFSSILVQPDKTVQLTLSVAAPGTIQLETSEDLTHWTPLKSVPANGPSLDISVPPSPAQRAFYRAMFTEP